MSLPPRRSTAGDRAVERGIAAIYFIVEPNRAQLVEITKLVDNHELRPRSPKPSHSKTDAPLLLGVLIGSIAVSGS
jgi:hypothetical protein